MLLPPKSQEKIFKELLQDLPPEIEELAIEFKAFTRGRKIKTVDELLRLVFLYCGLDLSFREVAGNLTMLDERITDEAVRKRLKACQPWIKASISEMLPSRKLDDLPEGHRFCAFDGSSIQAPGATGTDYRLHIGIDLVTLEFTHRLVTDKHTGESLKNYPLNQGDVAVVDRGLCHAAGILEKQGEGADVVARYNPTVMPLYNNDGTPLELIAELKKNSKSTRISLEVTAKVPSKKKTKNEPPAQLEGHLIVLRLSEKKAKAARNHCRKRASKKGQNKPTPDTLYLAGFLMVFTTLSSQILSDQTLLELYKCRWQIETAIKRLKSLLDIDKLRSKEGIIADIWLNGKLLYALMLENRMRKKFGDNWGYLNEERQGTWWRPIKLLKREIEPIITGVQFWRSENWKACLSVLVERPRRRKLQTLPKRVRKLLPFCQSIAVPAS